MKSLITLFFLISSTFLLGQPKHYDTLLKGSKGVAAERLVKYFNQNIIKSDTLEALNELDQIEQIARKRSRPELISVLDGLRGIYYFHYLPKKKDSSIILLQNAITEISRYQEFHITKARFTNVLGVYYYRAHSYQKALELILKSEYQFKKIGYDKIENMDFYLYNMGVVHFGFKQYEKAKEYIESSLKRIDSSDIHALQASYIMMGVIYSHMDQPDKVLEYYNRSKTLMIQSNDSSNLSAALGNIGLCYLNQNEYRKAITTFKQAVDNSIKYKEYLNTTSASLGLVRAYNQLNMHDSTSYWLTKTESLIRQFNIEDPEYLETYYLQKAILFDKEKKYRQASALKDSVRKMNEHLEEVKDLSSMMNINVELINAKRRSEVALVEEKAKNERETKILVILFSIILIIFFGLLWFFNYKKRKADKLRFVAEHKQNLEKIQSFKRRIQEKNILIENISNQMESVKQKSHDESDEHKYLQSLRETIILTEEDWIEFKRSFDEVYPQFINDLLKKFPDITQAELRFMVLLKLGLSVKEMANILAILPESVRKTRLRLTKKMGLNSYKELQKYVMLT